MFPLLQNISSNTRYMNINDWDIKAVKSSEFMFCPGFKVNNVVFDLNYSQPHNYRASRRAHETGHHHTPKTPKDGRDLAMELGRSVKKR